MHNTKSMHNSTQEMWEDHPCMQASMRPDNFSPNHPPAMNACTARWQWCNQAARCPIHCAVLLLLLLFIVRLLLFPCCFFFCFFLHNPV